MPGGFWIKYWAFRGAARMKIKTRKTIYFLGALWNMAFALTGLIMPQTTLWLLFGSKTAISGVVPLTFFAFFWVAVAVFAIGYYLVSRDPDRNEAVIWTGCLAKLIIFFTLGSLYLLKEITLIGFFSALVDLVWTVLFLAAMRRDKGEKYAS